MVIQTTQKIKLPPTFGLAIAGLLITSVNLFQDGSYLIANSWENSLLKKRRGSLGNNNYK
jgi:hypothetical protein